MKTKSVELRLEPWVVLVALGLTLAVGWMVFNPGHRMMPVKETPRAWTVLMTTQFTDDDQIQQRFSPEVLYIAPGDTVRWELENGYHNVAAYAADHGRPRLIPAGAEAWESPHFRNPGEAFERTFAQEGVYFYHCHPHEDLGMVGVIVVGHPEPPPSLDGLDEAIPPGAYARLRVLWAGVNDALSAGDGHAH